MSNYSRFVIFSVLFAIVYTLCFYLNIALFKYYPLVYEFHINSQPAASGPPILWYGWLSLAALVSLVVAFIIPRSWGNRISPTLAWLVPTLVLVTVLIYEKHWFV